MWVWHQWQEHQFDLLVICPPVSAFRTPLEVMEQNLICSMWCCVCCFSFLKFIFCNCQSLLFKVKLQCRHEFMLQPVFLNICVVCRIVFTMWSALRWNFLSIFVVCRTVLTMWSALRWNFLSICVVCRTVLTMWSALRWNFLSICVVCRTVRPMWSALRWNFLSICVVCRTVRPMWSALRWRGVRMWRSTIPSQWSPATLFSPGTPALAVSTTLLLRWGASLLPRPFCLTGYGYFDTWSLLWVHAVQIVWGLQPSVSCS